jgi:hypothetical protein
MAAMMYIPMTDPARRALIAMSVLWVAFAIVVFFRWLGRIRGAGIGADDVLSLVALVSIEDTEFSEQKLIDVDSLFSNDRHECRW